MQQSLELQDLREAPLSTNAQINHCLKVLITLDGARLKHSAFKSDSFLASPEGVPITVAGVVGTYSL